MVFATLFDTVDWDARTLAGCMMTVEGLGRGIQLFDFFSGGRMHLPFNEGYLRVVRSAFPGERITLHAGPEHLANLAPRIAGLDVAMQSVDRFAPPFGMSRYNPIGTRLAAAQCLASIRRHSAGPARLTALMGVDAALYAVAGRRWQVQQAGPLHMLLHGSLAANFVWRSRNPFIRWGDFRSMLRHKLRPGVRLIGLELGVAEAIVSESAVLAASTGVLEHPVLPAEWSDVGTHQAGPVSVGFLGYGSLRKGFDVFSRLARQASHPAVAFDAVGHADPGLQFDTGGLRRQLAAASMGRDEYLQAARTLDLICLPLHARSYDFAASGTISDAIAALKPVVALRSRTLQAIEACYGPIGRLFDTVDGMAAYLSTLDRPGFEAECLAWRANLRRLRDARRPEALGPRYALLTDQAA